MTLRIKYIIFISTLLIICLVLSYFIFEAHKLLFILSEILLIGCALIAINLYKQLIQPLINLQQGITAIKDQDFNVKFRPTGQLEVDELVEVYNHMIDALRIERTAQQEQHFFLEKMIQTSPTAILIMDYDDQLMQANPKAEALLSAMPELAAQLQSIEIGKAQMFRMDGIRTFKIQKSKFMDRGFERRFIMMEEVTAEIFQAEKEVYSKVIRMMAHEVNNTVGPVNSIIRTTLDQNHLWNMEANQLLKQALQIAIDRNQNLNVFMRNFAELVKLPPANKQSIDLTKLLRSLKDLMIYGLEERGIHLVLQLPDTEYRISADLHQLEQALINILKNAMESIVQDGNITIGLNPLNHTLSIIDDGPGIAEDHKDLLFSPFYSTKKDGQGIGLTLVREILINHAYTFSLRTIAAKQTEFSIIFH